MYGETIPIKIGPWGGSNGNPFDITEPSKRLESITIQFHKVIHSFGFSYIDLAGKKHTVGGPVDGRGQITTIEFAPNEYVKEFAGSTSDIKGIWAVTHLRIQTNLKTYEIHDKGSNSPFNLLPLPQSSRTELPFSIPLPKDTSIVGFFGRQASDLHAIGVYLKPSNNLLDKDTTQDESTVEAEEVPIKIGTWGGEGGETFDVTEPPKYLASMTIRAGNSVDALGFTYADEVGQWISVGPAGGTGGQLTTIEFGPNEFVRRFSGTLGQSFGSGPKTTFVASLQIETDIKTYGPYGKKLSGQDPFSIQLPEDVSIVGFFGRAGNLLDAIGIYIGYSKFPTFSGPIRGGPRSRSKTNPSMTGETDPIEETSKNEQVNIGLKALNSYGDWWAKGVQHLPQHPQQLRPTGQSFPIKIGAWGDWGVGGMEFDVTEPPERLDSVIIQAGDIVDSFGFSYFDKAAQKHTVGPYGGSGGSLTTIQLEPTEYVLNFFGTIGTYAGSSVVASLKIETNLGMHGPFGKEQDKHFSILLPRDARVVGFFGSAGYHLDAIGAYVSGSIPI